MPGLREQNKARRRAAILDATLDILEDVDTADITTSQIAARADVSAATVFNLVGTRDELFVALIERVLQKLLDSLADLDTHSDGDPITAARLIVDESVGAFIADAAAYRRIIAAIGVRHDVDAHIGFDPARLQEAAIREAQALGIIDPAFDPAGLGRQIYSSYSAAMLGWASHRIDGDGFLVTARHGLVSVLAATATESHRAAFRAELVELSHQLARIR